MLVILLPVTGFSVSVPVPLRLWPITKSSAVSVRFPAPVVIVPVVIVPVPAFSATLLVLVRFGRVKLVFALVNDTALSAVLPPHAPLVVMVPAVAVRL